MVRAATIQKFDVAEKRKRDFHTPFPSGDGVFNASKSNSHLCNTYMYVYVFILPTT